METPKKSGPRYCLTLVDQWLECQCTSLVAMFDYLNVSLRVSYYKGNLIMLLPCIIFRELHAYYKEGKDLQGVLETGHANAFISSQVSI